MTENNQTTHGVYPDPTKPVIPKTHKKLNWGWIIFIAFNISLPIFFLIAFYWMRSQ